VVRDAALRLKGLQLLRGHPSYSPSHGLCPRLWAAADGSGGLLGLEAGWAATAAAASPPQAARQPLVAQQSSVWRLPPWLASATHPDAPSAHAAGPSAPLPAPPTSGRILRSASQPPSPGPAPARTLLRLDADVVDRLQPPLPAGSQPPPPAAHRAVWRRLTASRIPLLGRGVAWRVLHGALYCGAFAFHVFKHEEGPEVAATCAAAGCSGCLETLTHLFVDCPCVGPALDWLLNLWQCIGGSRPPRSAQVLLADDHRVWSPARELEELWTLLRVEFLRIVWGQRCRRLHAGTSVQPAGIVAALVAAVQQHIRADWLRCQQDVRRLSLACYSSFPSGSPRLSVTAFRARWGPPGLLFAVPDVATDAELRATALDMRLTARHPMALPGPAPLIVLPASLD
jgi:hypothetical protein